MRFAILIAALAAGTPGPAPDRPVGILETRLPVFPAQATTLGYMDADATVVVAVDAQGRLTDALSVDATHPLFGEVSVDAVKKWKFAPAMEEGQPVASTRPIKFHFTTEGIVLVEQTQEENIESIMNTWGDRNHVHSYNLSQVSRVPAPVNVRPPVYPTALRERGIGGPVTVHYYIDQEGRARVPQIVGHPPEELAELALNAVQGWRFTPALRHGVPVLLEVAQTMVFRP